MPSSSHYHAAIDRISRTLRLAPDRFIADFQGDPKAPHAISEKGFFAMPTTRLVSTHDVLHSRPATFRANIGSLEIWGLHARRHSCSTIHAVTPAQLHDLRTCDCGTHSAVSKDLQAYLKNAYRTSFTSARRKPVAFHGPCQEHNQRQLPRQLQHRCSSGTGADGIMSGGPGGAHGNAGAAYSGSGWSRPATDRSVPGALFPRWRGWHRRAKGWQHRR